MSLSPGVYVGARKVTLGSGAGFMHLPGWHQFTVLVPRDPDRFGNSVTDLGGGTRGIIVGAYNVPGHQGNELRFHENWSKEQMAVREYFRRLQHPEDKEWFRTKMEPVPHAGRNTDDVIDEILSTAQKYRRASRTTPVPYPSAIPNVLGEAPNSNSWLNSVLEENKMKKIPDLGVYTPGSQLRLPESMFGKASAFLDGYLDKGAAVSDWERQMYNTRGSSGNTWENRMDTQMNKLMQQGQQVHQGWASGNRARTPQIAAADTQAWSGHSTPQGLQAQAQRNLKNLRMGRTGGGRVITPPTQVARPSMNRMAPVTGQPGDLPEEALTTNLGRATAFMRARRQNQPQAQGIGGPAGTPVLPAAAGQSTSPAHRLPVSSPQVPQEFAGDLQQRYHPM